MIELTEREKEVSALREQRGLSFRMIADIYQISPRKASQLYQQIQRKRRQERRQELKRPEKQKTVSFQLTLSEVSILIDILSSFLEQKSNNGHHLPGGGGAFPIDIDFNAAENIIQRLAGLSD